MLLVRLGVRLVIWLDLPFPQLSSFLGLVGVLFGVLLVVYCVWWF